MCVGKGEGATRFCVCGLRSAHLLAYSCTRLSPLVMDVITGIPSNQY
jgi:hypothetical protein